MRPCYWHLPVCWPTSIQQIASVLAAIAIVLFANVVVAVISAAAVQTAAVMHVIVRLAIARHVIAILVAVIDANATFAVLNRAILQPLSAEKNSLTQSSSTISEEQSTCCSATGRCQN